MLTLVLATHNGSGTLTKTLESFTTLVSPTGGWKLIVVDNASTDNTQELLQAYTDRLPLQILQQPKPGKNAALNLAIPYLEGELIIFTDDDVVAEPDWLITMQDVADKNPAYDLFGGVIRPLWPSEPPQWLLEDIPIRIVYAITADDLTDGPVHPGRIWGPNMAVRHKIFEAGHRFDEDVGPQPGQYRMGSETEFTTRLAGLGHRTWHTTASRVEHIVRPHQMDPHWIVRRAYRFGRDMFWKENAPELRHGEPWPADTKLLFGLPRWYYSSLLSDSLKAIFAKLRGDSRAWLQANWEIKYWQGYFHEAFREGAHLRRANK